MSNEDRSMLLNHKKLILLILTLFSINAFTICPKNKNEWLDLKEKFIQKYITGELPVFLGLTSFSFKLIKTGLFREINYYKQCPGYKDAEVQVCFAPLFNFIKTMDSVNSNLSNLAKLNEYQVTPYDPKQTELPEIFTTHFFKSVLAGKFEDDDARKAYKAYLDKYPKSDIISHYITFLKRKSLTIRTKDGGYEKFFHFDEETKNIILMIVIEKVDKLGKPLDPPYNIYFKTYALGPNSGKSELNNNESRNYHKALDGETFRCFFCHRNGPATLSLGKGSSPIIHATTSGKKFTDPKKYIEEFNNSIHELTDVKIKDYNFPYDLSPPYGIEDKNKLTKNYINQCSNQNLSQQSYQKIKKAVQCTSCHNDKDSKTLRFPFGIFAFDYGFSILKDYIDTGHMPPDSNLSDKEKEAVFRCLNSDYFGNPDFYKKKTGTRKYTRAGRMYEGKLTQYLRSDCQILKKMQTGDFYSTECEGSSNIEEILGKLNNKNVEKITITDGVEPEFGVNNQLMKIKNDQGATTGYERKVLATVCYKGPTEEGCEPINVNMMFDNQGSYLGLDQSDLELTKKNHVPFTEEDYKNLHILMESSEELSKIKKEDLTYSKSNIDAVTGATKKEYQDKVVKNAAYTSITLAQYIEDTKKQIKAEQGRSNP